MLNLPNSITILRLALIPVVVYLLNVGEYRWAFWLFVAAAVSDGIDGFLARRLDQRTALGAVLDPAADKLLVLGAIWGLAWTGHLPVWLAALIIGRDVVIVTGAVAYRAIIGTYRMAPSILGKLCTFLQFTLIVTLMAAAADVAHAEKAVPYLIPLVAAITIASGLQYVWNWASRAARRIVE